MTTLLLLSGGLDSSCVAAVHRPDGVLFIDYGQPAADAERRAATFVSDHLDLVLYSRTVQLSHLVPDLSSGVLPSPEWFPFRNQALATLAAMVALHEGFASIQLGLVAGDADRHIDGSQVFIDHLDALLTLQEGRVSVSAPAIARSARDLVQNTSLPASVLQRTHSCHLSSMACGRCSGCEKRRRVIRAANVIDQ